MSTRIPWLPFIPSDWKIGKVKQCFSISKELSCKNNPTILSLARSSVKIRDISSNEGQLAANNSNYNSVKPGDLLLNPMDLYSGANCNVSNLEGVISPAYSNLRAKTQLDPKFYDFYFKTQYWTMAMFAHGKGVSYDNRWTLNADTLLNYEIPVPSFNEQTKIVDFLNKQTSKIDQLISNQEKQIEKLKEYRQAILTKAVTKGLDPNVPMKDSGVEWIGKVPLNWMTPKFKNLATLSNGREIEEDGGDIPVYGSGGIFKFTKRPLFEGISLLTGRKGTIDNPMLVNGAFWTVDTMFYTSSINLKRVLPEYLFYAFKGCCNFGFYKSGSVLPSMTQSQINNIIIPLPTLEEQKQIIAFLQVKMGKIDSLLSLLNRNIEKLNSYKKSLIYEYVTGKKRVLL